MHDSLTDIRTEELSPGPQVGEMVSLGSSMLIS